MSGSPVNKLGRRLMPFCGQGRHPVKSSFRPAASPDKYVSLASGVSYAFTLLLVPGM